VLGDGWEAWLATLVVAAREALGRSWPDDWLTAPLWHFALGRDLAPPNGAAGVLVASMDRVGRFFPFTVIGLSGRGSDAGTADLHGWAGTAEALTLSALEDGFDPAGLDAALVALGPPPALGGRDQATGYWPLVFDGDWPIQDAVRAPGPDQSNWFCRGSDRVPATLLRCPSLPDRAAAAAMITGDFHLPRV
jgi:type VI secretion system protein ImpM